MQREDDIRFDRRPVALEHESARGEIVRNVGAFTRGSQLIRLRYMMMMEGLRWPALAWLSSFLVLLVLLLAFLMREHEVQLVEMHLFAAFWNLVDLDPVHSVNLTLADGSLALMPIGDVQAHPDVAYAWTKFLRCILVALAGSAILTGPLAKWFVGLSQQIGVDILKERHERGAMLVSAEVLSREITAHNAAEFELELAQRHPELDAAEASSLAIPEQVALGLHVPYTMAGIAYPWRLEQTHAMLIGTTGAGKTTQLRHMVTEARERGQRCVIFDLTGAFVEAFYEEGRDHILNPMDQRCPPWTIFNDCQNYADYISAAAALIPSDGGNAEPFWAMAARTLFVEMCVKLAASGETTNGAIAHHLMEADLKAVHEKLANTIASPLTALEAARMAESIRAVFNTNAQALRFLPDPVPGGPPPFSIRRWVQEEPVPGSILFITSTHTDLTLNRALLTLWMDLAVNALMGMPRTRDLRMWYLFDEVHALHRLPAIEHGLQTARGFGGAFVLGMHSFDKLCETYGDEGAVNLASLARTKLVLATADKNTAEVCSNFIGAREVRETDEAYSIGASRSRDAATITPRTEVKPLVIPDDIMNLPSLHGYVKFPEGFPAARIRLNWRDYPAVAEPFLRKTEMSMASYRPVGVDDEGEEGGDGGPSPVVGAKEDKQPVYLGNTATPHQRALGTTEASVRQLAAAINFAHGRKDTLYSAGFTALPAKDVSWSPVYRSNVAELARMFRYCIDPQPSQGHIWTEKMRARQKLHRASLLRFLQISVATWCRPDAAHDFSTDPKRGQWVANARVIFLNPKGRAQTKKFRPSLPVPEQFAKLLDSHSSGYWVGVSSVRKAFEAMLNELGLPRDRETGTKLIRRSISQIARPRIGEERWRQGEIMLGHQKASTSDIYALFDPANLGLALGVTEAIMDEIEALAPGAFQPQQRA